MFHFDNIGPRGKSAETCLRPHHRHLVAVSHSTKQVLAFALFLLLFPLGCKSTYSEKTVTTAPPPTLKSTTRVYIATPFDASYKEKVAQGSGKQTAQALAVAFGRYGRSVYTGKLPEGFAEALESARKYNVDYLVYPNIINWEDHETEWSGVRDRLEVKIDLIAVPTGEVAFSREVSSIGKWMTDGGQTPGDLLATPCEGFVNALYRRVEKPSALW
jgi:hypothetical protein